MSILQVKEKWQNVILSANYAFKESYMGHVRVYPLAHDRRNFKAEEAAELANQKFIALQNVSYGTGDQRMLQGMSLNLEPKKKYLILGDMGSGTKELMGILTKELPLYEGSITIKGRDLRGMEGLALRREISLISSGAPMVRGSVYDNVAFYGKYDWMKVRDCMGKVGLLNLENDHGGILDTEELGDMEKKRISIARALVNHSSILILDETAGSENNEEDYEIEELILNMREMTVLSISHRLTKSLMDKYDRIFILDQGTIVEEGTFSELLLNNDYFYNRYVSSET